MKKALRYLASDWQTATMVILVVLAVVGLLWFRLGTITPGISAEEASYRAAHSNLRQVADNPINIIHGLPTALAQVLGGTGLFFVRSVSAVLGLLIVVTLYLVLRAWHTERIAIMGTLLFASSPWFLHLARLATADIVPATIIGVVLLGIWLEKGKWPVLTLLALAVFGTLLIYTPGFIWLVVLGFFWQRKRILSALSNTSFTFKVLWFLTIGLLLTPLARAFWLQPELLRQIAGLPDHSLVFNDIITNILQVPVRIFYHGPENPVIWLGNLPLLDIFSTVMLVIGVYIYWFRLRLDRTLLMIGLALFGCLLSALSGQISAVLLPVIFIVVASGIALMLQQWFTVFPRNPLARSIATGLMVLTVALTVFYNTSHYFVAWPGAPETKAAFSQQP